MGRLAGGRGLACKAALGTSHAGCDARVSIGIAYEIESIISDGLCAGSWGAAAAGCGEAFGGGGTVEVSVR